MGISTTSIAGAEGAEQVFSCPKVQDNLPHRTEPAVEFPWHPCRRANEKSPKPLQRNCMYSVEAARCGLNGAGRELREAYIVGGARAFGFNSATCPDMKEKKKSNDRKKRRRIFQDGHKVTKTTTHPSLYCIGILLQYTAVYVLVHRGDFPTAERKR